jgi:hypothetical protein
MILKDSIKINAPAQAIFQFFEEMEKHYRDWHPDHVKFQWISNGGLKEGEVSYFEEYIAGQMKKMQTVYTEVVPNQYIEFVPKFWLYKLFLPRMLFRIEQDSDGCWFTAENHIRIGPIGAKMNKKELQAVRQHMKEEGENLKRIMEEGESVGSKA